MWRPRDREHFIGSYDPEHEMPDPDRGLRDRWQSDAYRHNSRDSRFAYRMNPDWIEGRYEGGREPYDRDRYRDARDYDRDRGGYERGFGFDRDYDRGFAGGYGTEHARGGYADYNRGDYNRGDYHRGDSGHGYRGGRDAGYDRGGNGGYGYGGNGGNWNRDYDRGSFMTGPSPDRDRNYGSDRGYDRDRGSNWDRYDEYDRDWRNRR